MIIPAERLQNRQAIKAEYLALRETYHGMVGSLYPAMAFAELLRLRALYMGDCEGWGDLPSVSPPNQAGYVI